MTSNFIVVMFAWIFFRCDTLGEAINYICQMCSFIGCDTDGILLSKRMMLLAVFITILFGMEWIQREQEYGLSMVPRNKVIRYLLYFGLFYIIMWFGGTQADFIYFQF